MVRALARIVSVLLLLGVATPVAYADVTLKMTTAVAGATTNSTTATVHIKGQRLRADTKLMDRQVSLLVDAVTNRQVLLNAATRRAATFDLHDTLAAMSMSIGQPVTTARPNGQTREILGRSCSGYDVEATLPLTMSGISMTAKITGRVWVATAGAGVEEARSFYAAARGNRLAASQPMPPGTSELSYALADTGLVLSQELELVTLAADRQAQAATGTGQRVMTMSITVTEISTDTIPDDMFVVPSDYANVVLPALFEEPPRAAPLNSWKTAKAGMKTAIDGNVLRVSKGEGWVRTPQEYLDFVFRVRYRVMTDDAEGALLLRAWAEGGTDWPTAGYRVRISGPKRTRSEAWLSGISTKAPMATEQAPVPVIGQWRDLEVTCRRDQVTVRIDGQQVADIQGREPNAGVIGIEARRGTIEYQAMSLAPLSSTGARPDASWLAQSGMPVPQLPVAAGGASHIEPPVRTKDVRPRYPKDAQAARIQGTVILEAVISAAGTVSDVRVLQSVDPNLDLEAIAAVRQWEFTPTILNGIPVPVIMTVTTKFSLQ